MSRNLGIPVKLLHEATGHIVTVELKSGELYRGSMLECEDNWNCTLENITFTAKSVADKVDLEYQSSPNQVQYNYEQAAMYDIFSWYEDGKVSQLEHVFVRGSKVRFMVIPDMLKNAPMFKKLETKIKGKGSSVGVGRGRAVGGRGRGGQTGGRGAAPGRGAMPPPIRR